MKNSACKSKTINGFSLLEVSISIGIIVVGILAITNLFFVLTKSAMAKKNDIIAIYLAEENIEIVRQIRDTNWLSGAGNWDQNINAGDKVVVPEDNGDIRAGFKLVNKNANSEKVYEDTAGGGYFQNLPPGLLPPSWKLVNFKRWLTIVRPDVNTIEVVSHVYYNGKEAANLTAVFKDWKN